MHFNHILVTTDFSTNAGVAYEIAAHQAKFEGSKITLLNVVSDWVVPEAMFEYFPHPERIEEYRQARKRDSEQRLKRIIEESFHHQKVTPTALTTTVDTFQAICDYARDHDCDLIVMASRGHGAVASLLLGSTVQRVSQFAHCPVMIVPSKS